MSQHMQSSSRPTKRYLTDPLNAHERHQLRYSRIAESYKRGVQPPRPQTKTELDVIKEKHQFIRDTDVDPATLSWEDQLALKYYNSLFREFALINLKHYKSGQPDPELVDRALQVDDAIIDPEQMDKPLVRAKLTEHEMHFGYVEDGKKKSALVKVVLCKDCGRKLKYGKDVAKKQKEAEEKEKVAMASPSAHRQGRQGPDQRDGDCKQRWTERKSSNSPEPENHRRRTRRESRARSASPRQRD
ncbi:hypothetical protein OIV83_000100 [Microbotryomycetes sp. JL201]|nr:hypothetical protein OIV83_000100 [Microbotryomycetes sp. JL201]